MNSIDVIIPCYNAAPFLEQCVASVLSQGIESLRVVIIDNASTDGTIEIARRLSAEDSRINVILHEKNLGVHASFNEGIDVAAADYCMILCADDLLAKEALKRAATILDSHPDAVFALGSDLKLYNGDELVEPDPPSGWRITEGTKFIEDCCRNSGFSLALGFRLVRTSVQKTVGHYRASLAYAPDLEVALRLAARGAVIEFDCPLGIRREHPMQLSATDFADTRARLEGRMAAFDSFFSRQGRSLPQATKLHKVARLRIAEVAIRKAARGLLEGEPKSAAALLAYGLRLSPAAMFLAPLGRDFRNMLVAPGYQLSDQTRIVDKH